MDLKFQNKKENYNLFSDDCDNDSFQISKTLYQANKDSPIKETLNEVLLDQKSPLQFLRGIEMTNFAKEKLHLKQTLPYEKTNSPSPLPENDLSISSIQGSLLIIFTYILTDIRKKPHSFKIGVFSIFIVVAFLIVLETAKLLTPALFIRLSEGEIGDGDLTIRSVALENDTRLTNESYFSNPFHEFRMLNGLNIEKICDLLEEVEGCSARWMLIGKTKHFNYSIQTFIIIIDSQKEKSIGLGRNSKANVEKLGNNECFLTESTMRSLNINDNYGINLNSFFSIFSK